MDDFEQFKSKQVCADMKADGTLRWAWWPTRKGRAARDRIRDLLFTVEKDFGEALTGGYERSLAHVQELGSCIVLLNEDTRDKLMEVSERKSDLRAVFSILTFLTVGRASVDGVMIGGLTSGGSFGGGGGGFGGFGGGGFGGGGAGGSW